MPGSVTVLTVLSIFAALQAGPLMCHVQEGPLREAPNLAALMPI